MLFGVLWRENGVVFIESWDLCSIREMSFLDEGYVYFMFCEKCFKFFCFVL